MRRARVPRALRGGCARMSFWPMLARSRR